MGLGNTLGLGFMAVGGGLMASSASSSMFGAHSLGFGPAGSSISLGLGIGAMGMGAACFIADEHFPKLG
jgi:hypothetical protein